MRNLVGDERRTPKWLFDCLNGVFNFTVDAAASKKNALLYCYWTKEDSGLTRSWTGQRVWINPPYSRGQILSWVRKAATETRGDCLAVILLPCDCSTHWFQYMLQNARYVLFMDRRLKFDDGLSPAKFGSVLAIFSPAVDKLLHKLDDLRLGLRLCTSHPDVIVGRKIYL